MFKGLFSKKTFEEREKVPFSAASIPFLHF